MSMIEDLRRQMDRDGVPEKEQREILEFAKSPLGRLLSKTPSISAFGMGFDEHPFMTLPLGDGHMRDQFRNVLFGSRPTEEDGNIMGDFYRGLYKARNFGDMEELGEMFQRMPAHLIPRSAEDFMERVNVIFDNGYNPKVEYACVFAGKCGTDFLRHEFLIEYMERCPENFMSFTNVVQVYTAINQSETHGAKAFEILMALADKKRLGTTGSRMAILLLDEIYPSQIAEYLKHVESLDELVILIQKMMFVGNYRDLYPEFANLAVDMIVDTEPELDAARTQCIDFSDNFLDEEGRNSMLVGTVDNLGLTDREMATYILYKASRCRVPDCGCVDHSVRAAVNRAMNELLELDVDDPSLELLTDEQILECLISYKEDNKLTDTDLCKELPVSKSVLAKLRKGQNISKTSRKKLTDFLRLEDEGPTATPQPTDPPTQRDEDGMFPLEFNETAYGVDTSTTTSSPNEDDDLPEESLESKTLVDEEDDDLSDLGGDED